MTTSPPHDVLDVPGLLAEIADLRARVERLEAARSSTFDRALLDRIVPVVAAVLGSNPFTVRDLVASPNPGLRLVLADVPAKRLGRLLARAAGKIIRGYVVERIGSEAHAVIWRIAGAS